MSKLHIHPHKNNVILLLGASGFIGNILYKELLPYYDLYGTYAHQEDSYGSNKVFYKYNVEDGGLEFILNSVRPSIVISALRGDFKAQYAAHKLIKEYCNNNSARILFLSTVNVFDGKGEFPSYENNYTHAESDYGKFKISIEKLLCRLPEKKYSILRLPLVLGVNSPKIFQLKQAIKHRATFETYPNLIVGATTVNKIAQQVHYIINKNCFGIFHLSSNDMVHHEDLFREISEKISDLSPIFTSVYSSNNDTYLALIPKENKLPEHYHITISEVIEDSTLRDEIVTLKSNL